MELFRMPSVAHLTRAEGGKGLYALSQTPICPGINWRR